MLHSMTGYGKSDCCYKNKKIVVECRSLNSKQMDANVRLPVFYRDRELDMRQIISNRLHRGKADMSITLEETEQPSSKINKTIVKRYYEQLSEIANELKISDTGNFLQTAMHLPDALTTQKHDIDEAEWNALFETIDNALDQLNDYRLKEGMALQEDIEKRINLIKTAIKKTEKLDAARIDKIKKKLEDYTRQHMNNKMVDNERFEQELLYFLEKMDITEEKVRLTKHCDVFLKSLNSSEPVGKKLGFIAQEMFREINTIGSKAADSDIQHIVVEMKDELEKIKEQLMNIL